MMSWARPDAKKCCATSENLTDLFCGMNPEKGRTGKETFAFWESAAFGRKANS